MVKLNGDFFLKEVPIQQQKRARTVNDLCGITPLESCGLRSLKK